MKKIGIIGGSGFEKSGLVETISERVVDTPWGEPSAALHEGRIGGVPVVMISRHGPEHRISPSNVNYRANIWALKEAGCDCILATTAVGSLREEIHRGDLVVLDQFIDFTRIRKNTYHEVFVPGEESHVAMPDPFDNELRKKIIACCDKLNLPYHPKGTVITIEGPRFSTRAESRMFRVFGGDVINMSIATEAELAAEAHIPYAAVGMSTDYDSWREDENPVTWDDILLVFRENIRKMEALLVETVCTIGEKAE